MSSVAQLEHRVERRHRRVEALPPRGGSTLEDVLSGVWEDLSAHRPAPCPVCPGELVPRPCAGAAAAGGRCTSCGTQLS